MDNILKEFWYGNISPFEQFYPNTKEMKELSGFIARHYDDLMARLPEKDKELLEKYNDNVLELEELTNQALFAYALSLGMRLAVACLVQK